MKKALIKGITGQDGSYLAEYLLEKGYAVNGFVRRNATDNLQRIRHILKDITIYDGDLEDMSSIMHVVQKVAPDEIYNLGAQSFVKTSFDIPVQTSMATGLGALNVLEAIRIINPKIKFYQAGSSEMYGKVEHTPQNEETRFHPRSPYGVAKVYAHYMTLNYRESYDIFACNGILFNHESPRRGLEFVTRKISHTVARIKTGLDSKLFLGNLDAKRDWGFAGDYVEAMHMMLQADAPDDYVVATEENHTVREFCEIAFAHVGLKYEDYVKVDPAFFRPAEVDILLGDASKAKEKLGWKSKTSFEELVTMMVESDMKLVEGSIYKTI
jgi:GDPmannose 4,6-dehydratase